MRIGAGRAKCSCGKCGACRQFRFGWPEFNAGDGNPAREHRDTPSGNRYTACQHCHAPGWHCDSAESEYSRLQFNGRNYTQEHDSRNGP
jgi:hypothetical protein